MSKSFIAQTAKDYDMPIHEVERIAKLFPVQFYEKLEEFIKARALISRTINKWRIRND